MKDSLVVAWKLSPPQRLLFFKKTAEKRERRKKGKGAKTGKAEKAREKWKRMNGISARFLSKSLI